MNMPRNSLPQAVCGNLETACQLSVGEGEKAPSIKPEEPIEGPVTKPLTFEVPYTSKSRHTPVLFFFYSRGSSSGVDGIKRQQKTYHALLQYKKTE